jgi:hypothetical protein
MVEPIGESRILPGLGRGLLQLRQGGNQGFRHVLAAELAIAAEGVGAGVELQGSRVHGTGERHRGDGAGHRRRSKISAA